MLYRYKSIDQDTGDEKNGTIEAATVDVAISALQRRRLIIVSVVAADAIPIWEKLMLAGQRVNYREVVILSRQIATLFHAQVPALRIFQMLSLEAENDLLRRHLAEIAEDIQGGMSLSNALGKHPDSFSDFYVNMVRAGEESGNLGNTFNFLADYLDRSYELISKTRNALIYPAFVISVFVIVMVLMLVIVIPKLSTILLETGNDLPVYTKFVIFLSNFLLEYGILLFAGLVFIALLLYRYFHTPSGKEFLGHISLSVPVIGNLYRKLYLARVSDNLHTMLSSGISMVRAVEISGTIVGNEVYRIALEEVADDIRTGISLSGSMAKHKVFPSLLSQMIHVGEETGEVGSILETLAKFYKREVDSAVDTLIGMIEPAMIVLLGLGVGGLLTSILLPIYDITATF